MKFLFIFPLLIISACAGQQPKTVDSTSVYSTPQPQEPTRGSIPTQNAQDAIYRRNE